jgi:hypothetical protein
MITIKVDVTVCIPSACFRHRKRRFPVPMSLRRSGILSILRNIDVHVLVVNVLKSFPLHTPLLP